MTRKRALIVSRNLPPLRGGMERLMAQAVAALSADYECHVIGPRGSRAALPEAARVIELPAFAPAFLLLGVFAVAAAVLRGRFALCVAGNGLVAPLAALGARLSRGRWLAFVHGLDVIARSRVYQGLFVPLLRRADAVIANSAHTRRLAEARGVAPGRVLVVHPGVELASPASARARAAGGPRLLSVGRLVPRKGVARFVAEALPRIHARHPALTYEVIGEEPRHAVNAARGERARIASAAQRASLTAAIRLRGEVPEAALQAAYAAADVLVFPSLSDDRDVEGFGMVVVEAAAHGVPAVAFDSGGVADALSPDSGVLVPPGDFEAFARAVDVVLSGASGVTPEGCRRHAARYAWPRFADEVRAAARRAAGDG